MRRGIAILAGALALVFAGPASAAAAPPNMQVPYAFQIGELFKIQDGRIVRIEALVLPVPFGMDPGWSR